MSLSDAMDSPPGLRAKTARGEVQFTLKRVAGGVHVERHEVSDRSRRTLLLRFSDIGEFVRWCDRDGVRHEHPLLHVKLKHHAEVLWVGQAGRVDR